MAQSYAEARKKIHSVIIPLYLVDNFTHTDLIHINISGRDKMRFFIVGWVCVRIFGCFHCSEYFFQCKS